VPKAFPTTDTGEEMSFEKSQTRAAWVSSIASIIAVLLAVIAIWRAESVRSELEREDLLVQCQHDRNDLIQIVEDTAFGPLVEASWTCFLANNSERSLSVKNVEVWAIVDGVPQAWTGMIQQMFSKESPEASQRIYLDSGEPTVIGWRLRSRISEQAFDFLKQSESYPNWRSNGAISKYLAQFGTDLFGNEVKVTSIQDDEIVGFGVSSDSREEAIFAFVLRTARGNGFSDFASWYGPNKF